MITSLISYPDSWDAIQIMLNAQRQIWNESVTALTDLDPDVDVIPGDVVSKIFNSPGYAYADRVERRIFQAWKNGD